MRDEISDFMNTRLEPGVQQRSARTNRPTSCDSTGLKPGINENGPSKSLRRLMILLLVSLAPAVLAAPPQHAEYEAVAEEYVKTYLAAHPLQGTALGFHEYDGKISDYSRLALDAELSRLHRFDDRLSKFDLAKLTPRIAIDLRILQTSIRKEIFQRQEIAIFERDPM